MRHILFVCAAMMMCCRETFASNKVSVQGSYLSYISKIFTARITQNDLAPNTLETPNAQDIIALNKTTSGITFRKEQFTYTITEEIAKKICLEANNLKPGEQRCIVIKANEQTAQLKDRIVLIFSIENGQLIIRESNGYYMNHASVRKIYSTQRGEEKTTVKKSIELAKEHFTKTTSFASRALGSIEEEGEYDVIKSFYSDVDPLTRKIANIGKTLKTGKISDDGKTYIKAKIDEVVACQIFHAILNSKSGGAQKSGQNRKPLFYILAEGVQEPSDKYKLCLGVNWNKNDRLFIHKGPAERIDSNQQNSVIAGFIISKSNFSINPVEPKYVQDYGEGDSEESDSE